MTPPLKPDVAVIDGKLAVFMGADYKLMSLDVADKHVRALQGKLAELKRAERRAKRKARAA